MRPGSQRGIFITHGKHKQVFEYCINIYGILLFFSSLIKSSSPGVCVVFSPHKFGWFVCLLSHSSWETWVRAGGSPKDPGAGSL